MLLMNSYYPALTRPNVDVITGPIARVRAHSIVTASGEERGRGRMMAAVRDWNASQAPSDVHP